MENPERERSGAGEEEDEDFHDCTDEPEKPNGESEEEFTFLEPEGQGEENSAEKTKAEPFTREEGDPEPDTKVKGDSEPVMAEKGEPKTVTKDKIDPESDTKEKGGSEVIIEEEDDDEIVMTENVDPEPLTLEEGDPEPIQEIEMDEEALQELEKDLSEDEREDRRKESTRLKEEGNELFKKTEYVEAEDIYSQALQKCPAFYKKDRSILFSNRAAARLKQDKNDLALTDCTKAIELNPDYVRALLRRAELYEKTEKLDEALADYKSVLSLDTSCRQAREACMRLPKQIDERNEKMKEEMISKLKSLGDLVLKPFGLSTNNFQVNQDADTGSYSINFVQNRNNNR